MRLIGLIEEDFINYKEPTMSLLFPFCSMKCNKECGKIVCQNSTLNAAKIIETDADLLCERYLKNDITKAICCYGMEPMDSFDELLAFVKNLRTKHNCHDPIVIYTGYYEKEIENLLTELKKYDNIIVKFGRYIPDIESRYDDILGITLASNNQYAKKIS